MPPYRKGRLAARERTASFTALTTTFEELAENRSRKKPVKVTENAEKQKMRTQAKICLFTADVHHL